MNDHPWPMPHEPATTGSFATPKQKPGARSDLFPYYAGFSEAFVEDTLSALAKPDSVVLDPWNGAGTTTAIAASRGLASTGVDLNPLMNLVASARVAAPEVWDRVRDALPSQWSPSSARTDVLDRWLTPAAAALVRGFERALVGALGLEPNAFLLDWPALNAHAHRSELCAAGVLVGQVARALVATFQTSNPTWIRLRPRPDERVSVDISQMMRTAEHLLAQLRSAGGRPEPKSAMNLTCASTARLPFADESFDVVVTSPPYCTRIDYVVATLPELAALGADASEVARLRSAMLGPPSRNERPAKSAVRKLPKNIRDFLANVEAHESKASRSYYLPYYASYFVQLANAITEISRVSTDNARAAIVVQNSHFREHKIDLVAFTAALARKSGWTELDRAEYAVPRPMALNPANAKYRSASATTEAAIFMQRTPR